MATALMSYHRLKDAMTYDKSFKRPQVGDLVDVKRFFCIGSGSSDRHQGMLIALNEHRCKDESLQHTLLLLVPDGTLRRLGFVEADGDSIDVVGRFDDG